MKNKIKLKKGDEVIVLAGKDKGKKGKIVRVFSEDRKVIVSDVNKYKKHQKPGNNEPGGIIEKDMPIHVSNVAFFDSVSILYTYLLFCVSDKNRFSQLRKFNEKCHKFLNFAI